MAVVYLDAIAIGHPRAQPRPRVVGRAVLTDSAASAAWKATIVAAIVDAGWTPPPADAPLELVVELAMPTAQAKREGMPAIGRPDLDNLIKAVADALMEPGGRDFAKAVAGLGTKARNYGGVIADDAQIVSVQGTKRWSPRPGGVRILLRDATAGG
ncbi:RusA family crossover junction endodeoxyribonuclease [Sphingomonas sanguinis]|uniref:RusA family crossover junction endodeoxyribonuclease n=1 Tax=Sphingomonas sp. LC-1 TaxID=3110957 RepID=UPI0021BAD70E|nr:RusA family crossover junction endodeoxyribonuclease [Sphingomonas sp. LC-1]MCT8000540.1 RusA family crossover junction endodeoxyribonuclease [Sphingomonas sp. LC-1]